MLIAHNLQGYIVQVSTLQKWAVQKNRYKMQTKTEKTNKAHYTQCNCMVEKLNFTTSKCKMIIFISDILHYY